MAFSASDKKEVFDFFVGILKTFDDFIYYEYVRGHVSKASPIVRKYVNKKCKGEELLDYFRKRKNYFIVEKYNVALKGRNRKRSHSEGTVSSTNQKAYKCSYADKLKPRDRKTSEPVIPTELIPDSEIEEDEERQKYEDYTIKYFVEYFTRHNKVPISWIEFDDLPKKVKRFLQNYFCKKVRSFFLSFHADFYIDDEDCVSLRFNREFPTSNKKETPEEENNKPQKSSKTEIDPELQKITDYYKSIQFFVEILRKKGTAFPMDKLSGYLSQASNNIRSYIKFNYKIFSDFFLDPSLIFRVDVFGEVSLSSDYNRILRPVKKLLDKALDKSLPPSELTLKSRMDIFLKPRIQKQDSFSVTNKSEAAGDACSPTVTEETPMKTESMCSMLPSGMHDMELQQENKNETSEKSLASDDTSSDKEGRLIEFIFSVELYCLTIAVEEHRPRDISELKTIKYFIQILEKRKMTTLTSLYGHLGSAPNDVLLFINKHYKTDKFKDFFIKHSCLFDIKSQIVSLSPLYRSSAFENKLNHNVNDRCNAELFKTIYESNHFKKLKTELFAYLYEVANYIRYKHKVKLSRIIDIRLRFSQCKDWINLSKGETLIEKTCNFLCLFPIFEFSSEGYIVFDYSNHSDLLLIWLEEVADFYRNSRHFTTPNPYYMYRKKFSEHKTSSLYEELNSDLSEQCIELINQIVNKYLQTETSLEYYALSRILPKSILIEITDCQKDSSALVLSLMNDVFVLKKGTIKLTQTDNTNEYYQFAFDNDTSFEFAELSSLQNHTMKNPHSEYHNDFEAIKKSGKYLLTKIKLKDTENDECHSSQEHKVLSVAEDDFLKTKDMAEKSELETSHPTENMHLDVEGLLIVESNSLGNDSNICIISTEFVSEISSIVPQNSCEDKELNSFSHNKRDQSLFTTPDNIDKTISIVTVDESTNIVCTEVFCVTARTITKSNSDSNLSVINNCGQDIKDIKPFNTINNIDEAISSVSIVTQDNSVNSSSLIKDARNSVQDMEDKNSVATLINDISITNTSNNFHNDTKAKISENAGSRSHDSNADVVLVDKSNDFICNMQGNISEDLDSCKLQNDNSSNVSVLKECHSLDEDIQDNVSEDRNQDNANPTDEMQTNYVLTKELLDFLKKDVKKPEYTLDEMIQHSSEEITIQRSRDITDNVDVKETQNSSENNTIQEAGYNSKCNELLENIGDNNTLVTSSHDNDEIESNNTLENASILTNIDPPELKSTNVYELNSTGIREADVNFGPKVNTSNSTKNRKKSDSGFEEYAPYFSEQNELRTSSSCSSCDENSESTSSSAKLSKEHLKEMSLSKSNLSMHRNCEKLSYFLEHQKSTFEIDSDSDVDPEVQDNRVTNIKMYLKECCVRENVWYENSENTFNYEEHSDDDNLFGDLFTHENSTDSLPGQELIAENYGDKDLVTEVPLDSNTYKSHFTNDDAILAALLSHEEIPDSSLENECVKHESFPDSYLEDSIVKGLLEDNVNQNYFIDKKPCSKIEATQEQNEISNKSPIFYDTEEDSPKLETFSPPTVHSKRESIFTDTVNQPDSNESFDDETNYKENNSNNNENNPPVSYPLQPLIAEIALLTTDSCIAQAKINSRVQTIYFLKSVFSCEEHECCTSCFNLLAIGDKVSCFVPLSEIRHKTWIAFMVSKENDFECDRMKCVNETVEKQMQEDLCLDPQLNMSKKLHNCSSKFLNDYTYNKISQNAYLYNTPEGDGASTRNMYSFKSDIQNSALGDCQNHNHCTNNVGIITRSDVHNSSISNSYSDSSNLPDEVRCQISSCMKYKVVKYDASCSAAPTVKHYSTQTSCYLDEVASQTTLIGSVKTCVNTAETECQTLSVPLPVRNASTQTDIERNDHSCQTVISFDDWHQISEACQTEDNQSCTIEVMCQTSLIGDVKTVSDIVDVGSQTFSTGEVWITKHYFH